MDISSPLSAAQDPPKPSAGKLEEIGISGLRVFSGVVNEEFLTELQGDRGRRVFREMAANDATVGAVLFAVDLILRSVKWRAVPKDENDPKAVAEALFLDSIFGDMSHTWEDFISEVLSMLVYGWSYHEIVFKKRVGPDQKDPSKISAYDDGRIGVRKLAPRAQDTLSRWQLQDDGGIDGLWQWPQSSMFSTLSGKELYIPIQRALLFRTTSRLNSPEGVSILRTAYRSWYFLRRVTEYEAIGIERELAGLPVVRIPGEYTKAGATDEQRAFFEAAKSMARDLKLNQQGGLVVPSDLWKDADGKLIAGSKQFDIELMKGAGTRSIDTVAVKNDYKRDITRAALADFLMLGQDKGAYSLGESKTDLFLKAVEAIMGQIAAPLNRFLIPRLWDMNGLDREYMPSYMPGPVAPADLAKLGGFLQQASASGMPLFPDEELENYVRQEADLPEKSEEAIARQEEEETRVQEEHDASIDQMDADAEATRAGKQPMMQPGAGGFPPKKPGGFPAKPGAKPGSKPPGKSPFGKVAPTLYCAVRKDSAFASMRDGEVFVDKADVVAGTEDHAEEDGYLIVSLKVASDGWQERDDGRVVLKGGSVFRVTSEANNGRMAVEAIA